MSLKHRVQRFLALVSDAEAVYDSDMSWKDKYSLIFSTHISGAILRQDFCVEWSDPDTSYEEAVTAYIEAIKDKAEDLKSIKFGE